MEQLSTPFKAVQQVYPAASVSLILICVSSIVILVENEISFVVPLYDIVFSYSSLVFCPKNMLLSQYVMFCCIGVPTSPVNLTLSTNDSSIPKFAECYKLKGYVCFIFH